MTITKALTDEAVLTVLGERLSKVRLGLNRTQADLAKQAGVSKRTVERFEAGGSLQLSSFIRLCRALDLMDRFDALIPEPAPSPMAQLKLHGKERRRAKKSGKAIDRPSGQWTWGDKK